MNPVEMPYPLPVNSKSFEPNRYESVSPSGAGFLQTIERNRPLWIATYTSPPLNDAREQVMRAFLDGLEGSANTFMAFDPRRPMPYAYRTQPYTATPWGSTPHVKSGDYSNSQLQIQFGANGVTITNGDYIGFQISNAWWLFRARQTLVTSGLNLMTINVTPRPPTFSGQNYVARLGRAGAEMKIAPGSLKWVDSVDSLPQVSFMAVQYVERN